jgi:oligoribonuclease NrnB/cAMP/cGMP phosphodiesterase (DHH superfamily)
VRRTCYFHAGCPDGFGAAWAVWRAWGEQGRYVARGHDDPLDPAAHDGEQVVFVDIAPRNALLRALAEVCAQVVVLDHHLSARDHYESETGVANTVAAGGHDVVFDLDHSGAVLAWRHFHPDEPVPELLRYVEDQDLWNWKLPRSEEVNSAIGSYAREFEMWDQLSQRSAESLAAEGEPILRANRIDVARSLHFVHPVSVGGLRVEAVNAMHNRSHIGHELAKRAAFGSPIGLVYRLTRTRVDVSIYSIGDLDVSAIAREHGGGGHRNASGFSVSLQEWLEHFA